ncbi:MAG TPA: hypothetical protein PLK23_08090 [Clostridia bacterium]|jgi:hypothetical protein|nr:hypothetical protein [Clostridia bacterium]HOM34276.1 hypothetical protein [Clostridia bacterium]HOR89419.1 hypothetical protein [Clostridia bacterium]HOT70772.1 hypothetical protein [Clostridia bacterium]HPL08061.1 hypothetical protein [Clostridia bacterium]
MFKKLSTLLLIVLVIGCLASCAKFSHLESGSDNTDTRPSHSITHSSDDTKPEEYYTAFRQGEFSVSAYLVTPYGMYINIGKYVYYSEKGNTEYVKLCNKPNCNHSTEDCNAYTGAHQIGYYKDKIYYTSFKMNVNTLNCMNMDGTNHKEIKVLNNAYISTFGYYHNGYFYYMLGFPGLQLIGVTNDDNNLYRVKVDDNSKPEIILTGDIIKKSMFYVVEDTIYLIVREDGGFGCCLYSYSCKTGALTKISDCWAGISYYTKDYGYCYRINEGIYKYNVETGEVTLDKAIKFNNHGHCEVRFYPDYIYLIHNRNDDYRALREQDLVLYIYNWDYEIIETVLLDFINKGKRGNFITDVGDYIIFASDMDNKPDYYIDKSEIGTDKFAFHKIEN